MKKEKLVDGYLVYLKEDEPKYGFFRGIHKAVKSFGNAAGTAGETMDRGQAGMAALNKKIDAVVAKMPEIRKYLQWIGIGVVSIIGLAVFLKIVKAVVLNSRKCYRVCKTKSNDSLSKICMLNCKIMIAKQTIAALKQACASSKNPEKCKAKTEKKIAALEKKIAELQKKVSYYKVN